MQSTTHCLVNAPKPQLFESASCWLSRLALSQGADLKDVMKYLAIPSNTDTDRFLYGDRLMRVRDTCRLPDTAFRIHDRVIRSLNKMAPFGENYLLVTRKCRPTFRYCPECLRAMRVPHFPIQWRFGAWRWCPEHDCLLYDSCPECRCPIIFPKDVAASRAGRNGYAMLNRCLECNARLWQRKACFLQVGNLRRVSRFEEIVLSNGRALLAALYNGCFEIPGTVGLHDPVNLARVEALGFLPSQVDWLPPDHVRERIVSMTGKRPARWRYGGGWNSLPP